MTTVRYWWANTTVGQRVILALATLYVLAYMVGVVDWYGYWDGGEGINVWVGVGQHNVAAGIGEHGPWVGFNSI